MDGPELFWMKIIDGKLLTILNGVDIPEHCAHVSPLLCFLHLQTGLKCCSEIAHDGAEIWR